MTVLATGCLLVSHPSLDDANFMRSVVYLLEHGEGGSLGLIINRPLEVPLGDLWEGCPPGLNEARIGAEGGPVERHKGLIIHGYPGLASSYEIAPGIHVGGEPDDLANRYLSDALHRLGPRLFLGHAGWAPEQLEEEVAQGAWIVRHGHPRLLLNSDPPDDLWTGLIQAGSGPQEPSLN